MSVLVAANIRSFGVSGWSQGVECVTGSTPDLADVVRAGAAWGRGSGLPELRAEFPFLHSSELARAHERGPTAVVEYQWRTLREQAAEQPDFTGFAELVEAAHAEPRLRRLCVFSSHWTLGFSSTTGYPSRVEVAIVPSHNGSPFRVKTYPLADDVLGEAATAGEAVALAVRHLRSPLGPAVAGTAEESG